MTCLNAFYRLAIPPAWTGWLEPMPKKSNNKGVEAFFLQNPAPRRVIINFISGGAGNRSGARVQDGRSEGVWFVMYSRLKF